MQSHKHCATLGVSLLLFGSGSAMAQNIAVTLNGQPVSFSDVGPQEIDGRVLVPVRGVLEKLGANVAWLPATRTVVASTPRLDIQLQIGNKVATVNGRQVILDVPAQNLAGHTMVPLRFLGESLGANVGWNGQTRTVMIVTNDRPVPHPTPVNSPAPTINRIVHNGNGWLSAGRRLNVEMEGTPGGQATFRIPGLVDEVPMHETSPGRYLGSWQVPEDRSVQLHDAAVIGQLRVANGNAPLLQAGQLLSVDASRPHIRDRSPDPNSSVASSRPNIYAVFEDMGSGVDRNSVHLSVNGNDVTPQANLTRDFISYTPDTDLPSGQNRVQITMQDRAGNRTVNTWNFTVTRNDSRGIRQINHNADHNLQPGDTFHIEMLGTPGGRAAFSLGSITNLPMREDKPGHYVADYTVKRNDEITNRRVRGFLFTPDGGKYSLQGERAVNINAGRLSAPVITYPTAQDRPGNSLVVRGKAAPNARVHVKVDYRNAVLGVLALRGTATDTVVTANQNGVWETQPISLGSLFSNRDMEYTLTATTLNSSDEESEAATVKFKAK